MKTHTVLVECIAEIVTWYCSTLQTVICFCLPSKPGATFPRGVRIWTYRSRVLLFAKVLEFLSSGSLDKGNLAEINLKTHHENDE